MALSPDGSRLATCHNENKLRVLNTSDGREVCTFSLGAHALVFSKDGDRLFAADPKHVHILDAGLGKEKGKLEGAVGCLTLSRDGRTLAGRGRRNLLIWDTKSATLRRTIALPDNFGREGEQSGANLALSEDGKTIAAVAPGSIAVWDTTTGKERYRNKDRFAREPIALAPNGQTVVWTRHSGFGNGHVLLARHDLAAGRDLVDCPGHEAPVIALAYAPDGKRLASVDEQQQPCIWSLGQAQPQAGLVIPGVDDEPFNAATLAYSPDGKVLAIPAKGTIRLLDPATGKEVRKLPGVAGRSLLAFARDGKWLVASEDVNTPQGQDFKIHVVDMTTGKRARTIEGGLGNLHALTFSPDGKWIAAGDDRGVRLWETATGAPGRRFLPGGSVVNLAFTPDGQTLIIGGNQVVVFDTATGREKGLLEAGQSFTYALALSADGKHLASAGRDNKVFLWDLASGALTRVLEGHRGCVHALAFAPDGKRLASGSDDTTILIWDVAVAGSLPATPLSDKPEVLWDQLAKASGAAGYRAIWALAAKPDAGVALIKERLKPVVEDDPLALPVPEGEPLRAVRAVEILERIGTPAAHQLLETLSKGPASRTAREAKAALARIDRPRDGSRNPGRDRDDAWDKHWQDLAEASGPAAHKALWALIDDPERTLARLKTRLKPTPPEDPDKPIELIVPPGEALRTIRAIEVLERIGTRAAREILVRLRDGPPSRGAREATAALERLDQQ